MLDVSNKQQQKIQAETDYIQVAAQHLAYSKRQFKKLAGLLF